MLAFPIHTTPQGQLLARILRVVPAYHWLDIALDVEPAVLSAAAAELDGFPECHLLTELAAIRSRAGTKTELLEAIKDWQGATDLCHRTLLQGRSYIEEQLASVTSVRLLRFAEAYSRSRTTSDYTAYQAILDRLTTLVPPSTLS
jgi:hypothetical protein